MDNEKGEVKVIISAVHRAIDSNETDKIKTETIGKFTYKNYILYVSYDEEGSKNLLKIKSDSVELIKKGELSSEFRFENGNEHFSSYKTPFGEFSIGVRTDILSVEGDLAEGNVNVGIKYRLFTDLVPTSDCTLDISIINK
ncbi:MAG: DUF1934 domain-containing protein [Lachnospiraceae bacterium]|nr:DUF1934 domain-containing protein [Lachnospiraceae bacterium]